MPGTSPSGVALDCAYGLRTALAIARLPARDDGRNFAATRRRLRCTLRRRTNYFAL